MKQPIARPTGGAISNTLKATGQPRKPSTLPTRVGFWLRNTRSQWASPARRRKVRALGRTAGHGLVRGIAAGLGTTAVSCIAWWVQR
ncbi:hypothetical protein GCM10010094_59120 [Streptomyces flaveus]|uniref:Uncharacterized protein n=1 Tax=Streptomyces flaveus TaxID=66370 RepID=A0A917R5G0_9ACTN|nr:hypothetical protein GCM10010094_59120 [Streptomyces flaveus]